MMLRELLATAVLLTACGSKPGPLNPAPNELDQRHCSANSECASGLCQNGRCG